MKDDVRLVMSPTESGVGRNATLTLVGDEGENFKDQKGHVFYYKWEREPIRSRKGSLFLRFCDNGKNDPRHDKKEVAVLLDKASSQ